MKIPLFDIDWTLLKGGNKVHNDAFDYVFKTIYNCPEASVNDLSRDGMIDNQIIVEVLKLYGIDAHTVKEKIAQAVEVMAEYFLQHNRDNQQSIPLLGSKGLLIELKQK